MLKEIFNRRIPQIIGSYLTAVIGILPSVIILSYFHGAPGKDEWTKTQILG